MATYAEAIKRNGSRTGYGNPNPISPLLKLVQPCLNLTCQKEGINVLDCTRHRLCQKCFQKNAVKFGADAMGTCPATECSVAVALSLSIYVDNSNIWIGAQNLPCKVKKFEKHVSDHRVRIDFGKLTHVIAKERSVGEVTLYGSKPPDRDSVWKKARKNGWKVVIKERSFCTGKEKEVDVQFTTDAVSKACSTAPNKRSTIVFVTGDADMYPAVEEITKNGWKVEIYIWNHTLSNRLKDLSKENKNVIYETLDAYMSDIVFIVKQFPPNGKAKHFQSVVLTLKPGAFPKYDIDDTWWNNLECIAQWPIQYLWIKRNGEEIDDLKLFFGHLRKEMTYVVNNFVQKINGRIYKYSDLPLAHVQWAQTYFDYNRRQGLMLPKQEWLSASTGKGMEVTGSFVRRVGQIYADITFSNKAMQSMENFVIQFINNSFGLAPGTLSVPSPLVPNSSASTLLPINRGGSVEKLNPLTQLPVTIKNNVDVFYFSINVPMHVLFAEDGKMDGEFQTNWGKISAVYEAQGSVDNVSLTADQIQKRLEANNVFLIARRQMEVGGINQELMYMSLKFVNNIWVLAKVKAQVKAVPGGASVGLTLKTSIMAVVPGVQQAFHSILHN